MYKIEVDKINKKMLVSLSGFMNKNEGEEYFKAFNHSLKEIIPNNYILVLEITEMKTLQQENVPMMKEVFKFYESVGFKNIYIMNPSSQIAALQLKRVLNEIQFKSLFIDNLLKAV